jgi:PAS domain S-box-containing protein
MLSRIRHLFAAPVFEDEEKTRTAGMLNTILLVLLVSTLAILPILSIPFSAYTVIDLLIGGVLVTAILGLQFLMRRGHVRIASVLLSCTLLVIVTSSLTMIGGIRNNASTIYFLVVAVAALLLGGRAALVFGLASILATLGVFYAETSGGIILPMPASVDIGDWIILSGALGIGALLLRFAVHSIAEGLERSRRHAQALAKSNRALQASRDTLEARARELTKERNFVSAVLETASALVVVLDPTGRIVRFNRVCEQTTGYSFEEVKGKRIWDFLLIPEAVESVKAVFEELCTGKLSNEYENHWIARDGHRRLVAWSNSVILNSEGSIEHIIATGIDITERKQAQREVEERRRYLEGVLRGTPDAIVSMDAETIVVEWNPGAERLFGYSAEEAVGRKVDDLITSPETREEAAGFTRTVINKQQVGPLETVRYRKDGSPVDVILAASPIIVGDEPVGGVAVYTDITERKRTEEQFQRYAADLEQANEEVKQFAYIVSHDLRGPLVNLKGFATELHAALEVIGPAMGATLPHLDEEQRRAVTLAIEEDVPEALAFIDSSVTRMDNFISAVLKLSRLGRRKLEPGPVDVSALVQATLTSLAHQIEEHQVQVSVGPLPQVTADRTSMEQIVDNILGNAVKYLDPDRSGELEITAERDGHETIFRVRDNGRGIAEEDMDKVFAPFRRAGRQDVPGEGMGLPYVQTLLRRHGGRIWCESKLGVGTTFIFTIPDYHTEGGSHA